MKNIFTIAQRVLQQLKRDKKFFLLTLTAPFVVIYFLKLFLDTLPATIPAAQYVMPLAAFVVFFFSFLLCAILLVQERTQGTLERLFINDVTRTEIIAGYTLGYMLLATLVAGTILAESLYLFNLSYSWSKIFSLFAIMWLVSLTSIMLGIFISTFARTQAQLFPFIPLIALPSLFLSGMLSDISLLPNWAQNSAHAVPLYYANTAIKKILTDTPNFIDILPSIAMLIFWALLLLTLASHTFKETE